MIKLEKWKTYFAFVVSLSACLGVFYGAWDYLGLPKFAMAQEVEVEIKKLNRNQAELTRQFYQDKLFNLRREHQDIVIRLAKEGNEDVVRLLSQQKVEYQRKIEEVEAKVSECQKRLLEISG